MPSAVPLTNGTTNGTTNGAAKNMASTQVPVRTNGVNGTANGVDDIKSPTANDRIQRFTAPSRSLSPRPEHMLFHEKTRCFV